MTDSTLRTLERRWHASGAINDESRYLVERVRSGDLPQINLRLAALCGCPPAVAAMGPGPEEILDIQDWMTEFKRAATTWYPELQLRAAHAACWVATLTLLGQRNYPWMPGAIGRVFQLTAYRILGGVEPDSTDVITPLQQEHVETMEAIKTIFGNLREPGHSMGVALQILRNAAAFHATKRPADAEEGANYSLCWAAGQIGVDGVYHALGFLLAPYLIYGEDSLVWWREGVRFLYASLNLHIKSNPWWAEAAERSA